MKIGKSWGKKSLKKKFISSRKNILNFLIHDLILNMFHIFVYASAVNNFFLHRLTVEGKKAH